MIIIWANIVKIILIIVSLFIELCAFQVRVNIRHKITSLLFALQKEGVHCYSADHMVKYIIILFTVSLC